MSASATVRWSGSAATRVQRRTAPGPAAAWRASGSRRHLRGAPPVSFATNVAAACCQAARSRSARCAAATGASGGSSGRQANDGRASPAACAVPQRSATAPFARCLARVRPRAVSRPADRARAARPSPLRAPAPRCGSGGSRAALVPGRARRCAAAPLGHRPHRVGGAVRAAVEMDHTSMLPARPRSPSEPLRPVPSGRCGVARPVDRAVRGHAVAPGDPRPPTPAICDWLPLTSGTGARPSIGAPWGPTKGGL